MHLELVSDHLCQLLLVCRVPFGGKGSRNATESGRWRGGCVCMRCLRGGKRSTALQARDHCKQAPDAGMVSLREARCWGLWEDWPGQAHQSCQIDQYQPTGTRVSGPRALRPRLCCPAWTWRGETTSAAPEHWRPRCPSEAASCVWCALTFVIAVRRPQRRVPDRRNGPRSSREKREKKRVSLCAK